MPRSTKHSHPLLHIAASNLVTALGNDGATTAAAWVSRRRCFRTVDVDGAKLYTAPATDITQSETGFARIRALLAAVLKELPAALGQAPQTHRESYSLHCMMLLPAWLAPHERQFICDSVRAFVAGHVDDAQAVSASSVSGESPLASHIALHAFMLQSPLAKHRQRLVMVVADSLCEPAILHRDHAEGLVGHTKARKLDTAGEAAAYVVLDTAVHPHDIPRQQHALHLPAHTVAAPTSRWNSLQVGDGKLFADAMERALKAADLPLDNIGHYIDDNEDQNWRNEDRYAALSYLTQKTDTTWHAQDLGGAERLGQLGVATGVLHWALADTLQRRGLAHISTLLSCSQHRDGSCAAVLLQQRK